MDSTYQVPARTRPSGWWYVIAPLFVVGGIVLAIQAGFNEATKVSDSFEKLSPDGKGSVFVESGERASIWAVYPSSSGAEAAPRPDVTAVVTAQGGEVVAVRAPGAGSSTHYSLGSESGLEVGSFRAPRDGQYDVSVSINSPAGATALPTAAVGQLDIVGGIGRVLRPVGWGIVAMFAWIILLVILRGSSKRRNRSSMPMMPAAPVFGAPGVPNVPGSSERPVARHLPPSNHQTSGAMPKQDPPAPGPFL